MDVNSITIFCDKGKFPSPQVDLNSVHTTIWPICLHIGKLTIFCSVKDLKEFSDKLALQAGSLSDAAEVPHE